MKPDNDIISLIIAGIFTLALGLFAIYSLHKDDDEYNNDDNEFNMN